MKKTIIIFILLFVVTGCSSNDRIITEIENTGEYSVMKPYKKAAGDYYTKYNYFNTYNKHELETTMLEFSKKYFSVDKNYYEEGQFFSKEDHKELISDLNELGTHEINNENIDINIISGFIEGNFYNNNKELRGVSLIININPYITYQNSYGTYKYEMIEDDYISDLIKPKVNLIIDELYSKIENQDIDTLIMIYYSKEPNSSKSGYLKYFDLTDSNSINLIDSKIEYTTLDDTAIDSLAYSSYKELKSNLKEEFVNMQITSRVKLQNKELKEINIEVSDKSFSEGKAIYLTNELREYLKFNFLDVKTEIIIKENDKIISLIRNYDQLTNINLRR